VPCPGFEPTTSGFKSECANRTAISTLIAEAITKNLVEKIKKRRRSRSTAKKQQLLIIKFTKNGSSIE
jgi:hypothetical protein